MKYEAQRSKLQKLASKLTDIQDAFKFDGVEIVRNDSECVDDDKIYLIIDYNEYKHND